MKKKGTILFMLVTFATILSCNKYKDSLLNFNDENIKVMDRRLVFKDQAIFETFTKEMLINQDKLKDFMNQFEGFTSFYEVFEPISEDENLLTSSNLVVKKEIDHHVTYDPIIDYGLMQHLLNPEGIIQIGDIVYRVTYNFVLSSSLSDIGILMVADGESEKVSKFEIERDEVILPGSRTCGITNDNCYSSLFPNAPYTDRRTRGKLVTANYLFRKEARVEVFHEKLNGTNVTADEISIIGSIQVWNRSNTYDCEFCEDGGGTFYQNNVQQDKKKIIVVLYIGGISCNLYFGAYDVDFLSKIGGASRGCNLVN